MTCTFSSLNIVLILLCAIFLTYMFCPWLCPHSGCLLSKCCVFRIGVNGAKTSCGISHILGILVMNSLRLIDISSNIHFPSVLLNCVEREIINEIYIYLSVNLAKVTLSSKRLEDRKIRIRLGNWLNKIWPINSNSCLLVRQIRQKSSVSIPLFWKLFIYSIFICIKLHVIRWKEGWEQKGCQKRRTEFPIRLARVLQGCSSP